MMSLPPPAGKGITSWTWARAARPPCASITAQNITTGSSLRMTPSPVWGALAAPLGERLGRIARQNQHDPGGRRHLPALHCRTRIVRLYVARLGCIGLGFGRTGVGESVMTNGHVFAGVVRWPGGGNLNAPPGTLGGVFRLGVGETRWEHMTAGLPEICHVPCLTADPHDSRRIYAGTQEGPYLSTDGGSSWQRLDFPHRDLQVWAIAVHPRDPRKLYVGTSPLGVFISADGGGTWSRAASATLPDHMAMGSFRNRVMRFAFNPERPEEMFAALEVRGVIRSTDGGENWQDCSEHLIRLAEQPHLQSAILTTDVAEGMLDVHAIAISAAAPETPIVA